MNRRHLIITTHREARVAELETDQPCQELRDARLHRRTAKARIEELEAKLRGMTATMQHWRTLAGQMTEARDALLGEEGVLREMLEAEKAAHVCGAAIIRTIRTPDLVIEEE